MTKNLREKVEEIVSEQSDFVSFTGIDRLLALFKEVKHKDMRAGCLCKDDGTEHCPVCAHPLKGIAKEFMEMLRKSKVD